MAALACALMAAQPAAAQLYPKIDYYEASVEMLREAVIGTRQNAGSVLGTLASLNDPELRPLFEGMLKSEAGPARVFGVLGCALSAREGTGLDPRAVLALPSPAERAVVVREANATGVLRHTDVAAILESPDLEPGTVLTLTGERARRGEPWDSERLRSIVTSEDAAMAGIASLLLQAKGEDAPWNAFTERWKATPEPLRSAQARGLAEGSLVFDIRAAVPALLSLLGTDGLSDDAQLALVGAALTLAPEQGLPAWETRVAARRSQPQLMRAGLQILTADEAAIPASAFERIRNGSQVLDAIADCGVALRSGRDPSAALITLIDAGSPVGAEWALMRARKLPPEQAARVWKHVLASMEAPNQDDRPTPVLVALAVRELMKSEPAAVTALVERARNQAVLAVAILSGVYESREPEGAEIARALRGALPRSGESLAALVLARTDQPLTDADFDALGRAAAGGGDLESMRAVHAAWYLIKRRGRASDAISRALGEQPVGVGAPGKTP